MRYRLTIAYDGSRYHGWQEQLGPDGRPNVPTVQSAVRHAVQFIARQPVVLRGASRTDTGVHADGQTACFDADHLTVPLDRLARAINSRLPEDIEIRRAEIADPAFDVIGDVLEKQYRYRIWNTERRPLAYRHTVYHCWTQLDLDGMARAGEMLVGHHNFAAFTNAGHGRVSTFRTLLSCDVERRPLTGSVGAGGGGDEEAEVHVVVRGEGFLYNMVRIIAGTLVEVGRGRFDPDHIQTLLREGDRHQAGPTLPPQGLCLEWIRYGPAGCGAARRGEQAEARDAPP